MGVCNTMRLSIILPSIHQDSLQRMLGNIFALTKGDYEVVVVSPFRPEFPARMRNIWVPESERLGSSGAQAYGFHYAVGEFVVALSDDVELIRNGWDLDVVRNFKEKELGPLVLDMRLESGGVNAVFGHTYATLPMMRKEDAQCYGWYDPIFFSRYGDSDLSLRIWKMGGCVAWSNDAIVRVHSDNARNGMTIREDDRTKFLQRWKPRFPDWPNDPAKYDCGIDMDKIGYFEGNTANFPTYQSYHEARRLAGHRGYDGTVAADGKIF